MPKTILNLESPVSQSVDAVKALLSMGFVLQNRDWLCGRVYKSADLFETAVNVNSRLMSELQNGNFAYSATGWTA